MAQPAHAQCVNYVAKETISTAAAGAFGYLGANLFTTFDPVHGAVFGVVAKLVGLVAEPIIKKILVPPGANDDAKFLAFVVLALVQMSAAVSICAAAGFQMTLSTAVALMVSQIGARLLVGCICDDKCAAL
jgi:phosphate/sulfate permease